jgi:hypothetical protein
MTRYWPVAEAGARFGKYLTDPRSPRETALHTYVSRFDELLDQMRPVYKRLRAEDAL